MPLTLTWRDATTLPVAGEMLSPDRLSAIGPLEAALIPSRVGRMPIPLGDLFRIDGDGRDGQIILEGDLSRVVGIGRGMTSGSLIVRGDAGALLGAGMLGGSISVEGSVGDWAAAEMRGGVLRVLANAGEGLAAALPGSRLGMRDGTVLVHGTTGADAGLRMRRGLIALGAGVGADLGRAMVAGSIFAFGPVGPRPGAGMKRGTIALFGTGSAGVRVLPTFAFSGRFQPPFLAIYRKLLDGLRFPVALDAFATTFARYNGDLTEGGQGEILVADELSPAMIQV
ncbi:formylmethanofuran dehydrogenase subunit C [Isosphaeraceae bacterium EP7]